jgi:3-dehydroquinate dehydratase type I
MSGHERNGVIPGLFDVDAGGGKPGSDNAKAVEEELRPRVRTMRICGCLTGCSPEDFPKWLNHPEVDLVEWRMDKFADSYPVEEMNAFLVALSGKPRLPVIATNRPFREMGAFAGREDVRLRMLEDAARSGADWIDIEYGECMDMIAPLREAGSKVLVSWHNPAETPGRKILRTKLENMCKPGADALKIVTMAQSDEDNLRVLELIPLAGKELGVDLVAFCMGPAGGWSRLASLFLGSPWTYAQFAGQSETAPGQLSVSDMRGLIRRLARM